MSGLNAEEQKMLNSLRQRPQSIAGFALHHRLGWFDAHAMAMRLESLGMVRREPKNDGKTVVWVAA